MSDSLKILAGVVGDPISHSLSPQLHGYWLSKYNINGEYQAFHVTSEDLPEFLSILKTHGISGVNLTVPHKEQAMRLVDEVDIVAQRIGAINTIYFDITGKMIGTNTDGYGFLTHLKQSAENWRADIGPVVIMGAGGAARAVIISLLDDGVAEIRLTNRTQSRAQALATEINDPRIRVIPWEVKEVALGGAALLVNVTTLGMQGQPPLEISLNRLPPSATVYDIVYNPLETELLKKAKENGNICVDGLGMLLHQAAAGFELWYRQKPIVDDGLRKHMLEAL